MIKAQSVSKHFNSTAAVTNISFEVGEGENFVLLGTSGCGKTTTLRMINRLTEPSSGNIFVNGKNIQQQDPQQLRQGIGYVLQHTGLFPHYTVAENIAVVPKLLNWGKTRIQQRTYDLLGKLGLAAEDYADVYPAHLSGGQQQRVGLARALAANPPLLLMDEPFGALDPVTRSAIRNDFTQLEEFKVKTIVLVTHDVQEAFQLGDRICLMDKGRIIQAGTPKELLFKPANEFVKSFFREHRFVLEMQTIKLEDIVQYLPATSNNTKADVLAPASSVWHALEGVSVNQAAEKQAYIVKDNKDIKEVGAASLMEAYSKYKIAKGE